MTERKQMIAFIGRLRTRGCFLGGLTEVSWTAEGVLIDGEHYTTMRALRQALDPSGKYSDQKQ